MTFDLRVTVINTCKRGLVCLCGYLGTPGGGALLGREGTEGAPGSGDTAGRDGGPGAARPPGRGGPGGARRWGVGLDMGDLDTDQQTDSVMLIIHPVSMPQMTRC